jgi:hypothetical protein
MMGLCDKPLPLRKALIRAGIAVHKWELHTTPESVPVDTNRFLTGVSCTSAWACTAIGTGGLGAQFCSDFSWQIQSTPGQGANSTRFNGVSCVVGGCMAVSGDLSSGHELAEVRT